MNRPHQLILRALSGLSPPNFSLKNFLNFSLKKLVLKKFLIFSQKSSPNPLARPPSLPTNFQGTELSCIFFKTKIFLIFQESYIQKPGIFKTWDIFRTPSNIYDGTFHKNGSKRKRSYLFLYFRKQNFLALILINFKKLFIFQETFQARKMKKIHY